MACQSLGRRGAPSGKDLGLCDPKRFDFAWIVDFPMFEGRGREQVDTAHHMFTMPHRNLTHHWIRIPSP